MGTSAKTPVTVVGLGLMGQALAAAFLAEGHPTTAWNRSPEKGDELVAKGARRAESVADAVAAGPVVVICVRDYPAVHQLLDPVVTGLAAKVLVNLTSGSPEQGRETAAWAAAHGVGYLDGAIMITPPGIGQPGSSLLYSGAEEVFERHRGLLEVLGGDTRYLGTDPGLASLYDSALLGLMWSTLTGWLHGVALVGADKVAATDFTPFAGRWLDAVKFFMSTYAPQVDAGRYPGDDATLDTHLATIEHLVHASEHRGIDTEWPKLYKRYVDEAIAAGHGGDSYARLVEVLRGAR